MTPDDMEAVVSEWLSLVETFTPHNYSRVRHVPVCQGEVSAIRALLLDYQERGRALEPFAAVADLYRETKPDYAFINAAAGVTVGECRRARATLKGKSHD